MTTISKTTINFARKRGLDVTIENVGEGDFMAVWDLNNDCEWMFTYQVNDNGSFTYNGNVWLPEDLKEELPGTLKDEKHVREMLAYIGANRHLWKDL
ncbi:hypothetical protein [Citrobacter phage IME-JL8]|uniref:Uncharacterized protein n=2 Tax=Sertoctavirus SRT8 TaxID=2560453 RepID=A0A6G6XTG9_9CAUD|nr:hypothetical protein FDI72_gp58 [Escherichia phage SRT8]ATN93835.1 hypothetical protein [Escherichia phage SRT8]QIG62041.1 hypothetical protein [Citrobacter phage IME-JL8]